MFPFQDGFCAMKSWCVRWTALILFCVFAVVLVRSTSADESPPRALRIVAFNTQCLAAPDTDDSLLRRYRWETARRAHIERVADVIETLQPDVMALLEVTSKPSVDLLIEILKEKGLDQYRAYHIESKDRFTGFDVAFVSRFEADLIDGEPIRNFYSPQGDMTWREPYAFTNEKNERVEREAALIRHSVLHITVDDRKLGLLGLHLKADPSDDYSNARRTAEVQIARRIIQKEIVARGYTPIVLGDLNDYDPDVPDRDPARSTKTRVIKQLKDYDDDAGDDAAGDELVNVAAHIKRIADRYTSHWDLNENAVADEGDVYTMIDHILVHKSLSRGIQRAFVCRLTDLKTSDHWPLVVDLLLPSKSVAITN